MHQTRKLKPFSYSILKLISKVYSSLIMSELTFLTTKLPKPRRSIITYCI